MAMLRSPWVDRLGNWHIQCFGGIDLSTKSRDLDYYWKDLEMLPELGTQ